MQRGRGVLKCKTVDQGSVPEVVFLGGSLNTPVQAFPKWAGTPGGMIPEGTHPSVNMEQCFRGAVRERKDRRQLSFSSFLVLGKVGPTAIEENIWILH